MCLLQRVEILQEILFEMGDEGVSGSGCAVERVGREELGGTPPLIIERGDESDDREGKALCGGSAQLGRGVVRLSVEWGMLGGGARWRRRGSGGRGGGIQRTDRDSKMERRSSWGGLVNGGMVSKEVEDGLEKSSRRAVEREVERYERWCRERKNSPWPLSAELLEGYVRSLVVQGVVGAGVDNVVCRVRRKNREKGGEEVVVTQRLRDAMMRAKKDGKRGREVVPVVWEWIENLWRKGWRGDWRFVAVVVGLGMRLMLRPGEWARIRLEHVRRVEGGVCVRLVGRKTDKVVRRDPWHLVECGGGMWCVACCVVELAERRRREGADEREGLFVDRDGRELKAESREGEIPWGWKEGV